ncbi:MAG TPA: hypothetical protein ENK18_20065 [Deltaproteobacteria bacterium]|nr:hypothetical protein [Deltaproteobacteria bacterium]
MCCSSPLWHAQARIGYNSGVPHFRIQSCVGRGGFGEVYKGVMSRGGGLEVDVAIKLLRPDLKPNDQGLQRLRDEGRLLGRLTHPTILRVYDLVTLDGRAALVTEYVAGDDLGQLLTDEVLPARAVYEVIAQVAAALDAAWSWPSVTDGKPMHLVHRDIKPDNIRIDPNGVVKLLDFGIARAGTIEREAQTSSDVIMGSAQYLAPERLVQQEIGPESDIFALGCTMFEALTAEALFARKSMRQMYLLMVEPRRYEEFVADRCTTWRERLGSDRALALIKAMTAYRKADRPRAAEVAARCDLISDGIPGPTLTQWSRGRDWVSAQADAGPLEGRAFETSVASLADLVEAEVQAERQRPELTPGAWEDVSPPDREPPGREPVLGEVEPQDLDLEEVSALKGEGPTPWTGAELAALFSEARTPSLAPRHERGADVVINRRRIAQLGRQRWEDGAAEHRGAPSEQTPSEQTPSEQTPSEQTPVDPAPAEASSSDPASVIPLSREAPDPEEIPTEAIHLDGITSDPAEGYLEPDGPGDEATTQLLDRFLLSSGGSGCGAAPGDNAGGGDEASDDPADAVTEAIGAAVERSRLLRASSASSVSSAPSVSSASSASSAPSASSASSASSAPSAPAPSAARPGPETAEGAPAAVRPQPAQALPEASSERTEPSGSPDVSAAAAPAPGEVAGAAEAPGGSAAADRRDRARAERAVSSAATSATGEARTPAGSKVRRRKKKIPQSVQMFLSSFMAFLVGVPLLLLVMLLAYLFSG